VSVAIRGLVVVLAVSAGLLAGAPPAGATDVDAIRPAAPFDPLAAYSVAPCDPNGPTTADAELASRLNSQLQGDMRGSMTAYRTSCARMVVAAARARGLARRAATIAITTVIVETHIQNIDVEVDHDSLGLFQQRASWGTRAQRLDPTWATNAFLDAMLRRYPNGSWQSAPIGEVCQAVQVSAFPERYQPQAGDAQIIVDALWAGSVGSGVGTIEYGGALRVFARGADGNLWQYSYQDAQWRWDRIGGAISGAPTAIVFGNVLRVFVRDMQGSLTQYFYLNGNWSSQVIGGGISSAPSAIISAGLLRIFARGDDGALWQAIYTDRWTWQQIGGGISSAPSAIISAGLLRIFARGDDGALWQAIYTDRWAWQQIGGLII
jgi:hypothetical protein